MSQADFWLKIQGIDSESKDEKNEKQFQLQSFSFGATNSGSAATGTGMGTGKVSVQDFHFTISHSKASAKLFQFVCKGEHIPECKLTCRKAAGKQEPYMIVTFTDVLISSYQTSGSEGSDSLPMDQISFNFSKIKYETKVQDAKGVVSNGTEATHDLKLNKTS